MTSSEVIISVFSEFEVDLAFASPIPAAEKHRKIPLADRSGIPNEKTGSALSLHP